jgi:hypothetical protein
VEIRWPSDSDCEDRLEMGEYPAATAEAKPTDATIVERLCDGVSDGGHAWQRHRRRIDGHDVADDHIRIGERTYGVTSTVDGGEAVTAPAPASARDRAAGSQHNDRHAGLLENAGSIRPLTLGPVPADVYTTIGQAVRQKPVASGFEASVVQLMVRVPSADRATARGPPTHARRVHHRRSGIAH